MKIIRNNIIPFGKDYAAINLFGVFFVKRGVRISPGLINHESIHTAQMRELLYLPFYLIYVVEWAYRLIQTRGKLTDAYFSISFEREAYAHGDNLSYLPRRRHFAQWRKINACR